MHDEARSNVGQICRTALVSTTMLAGLLLSACMMNPPLSAQPLPSPASADENATSTSSMRITPVEVEDMDARQRKLLGIVEGEPLPRRAKANLFKLLMNHPDLTEAYTVMGDWINVVPWGDDPGQIGVRQKELMIMRIAWLYQGHYEWSRHYQKALDTGLSEEEIERIKLGGSADGWSSDDKALLDFVSELVETAEVSDASWTAFREHYSDQNAMEVITLVTHYHWVTMMGKTLQITPESAVPAFDAPDTGDVGGGLKRETAIAFVEGPAWRDGVLYFTDIPNNRIMAWSGKGRPKVHLEPSGYANGLMFDREGRLLMARDSGSLARQNEDGSIDVIASGYNGKPFNALNDLAIDSKGRIYFTDPAYNNRAKAPQRDADGTVVDGVYRLDPDGTVTRIATHEISLPNGILISPDDRYIWIAENSNLPGGSRKLLRYDLNADGSINFASKLMAFDWGTDRGPDGMAIDTEGSVYVAAGLDYPLPNRTSLRHKGGIYMFKQDGVATGFIPIPVDPASNVTFGGEDNSTLYVTAGYTVWSYPIEKTGYVAEAAAE